MKYLLSICLLCASLGASAQSFGGKSVDFVLKNTSVTSIPLEIPQVMNPNLSPFSTSYVSIPVGTEVSFFYKRKKYPLLTVKEGMAQEQIVNDLIKARIKELQLK
jgi:hypothetical protein